jgi:hypothetical protein
VNDKVSSLRKNRNIQGIGSMIKGAENSAYILGIIQDKSPTLPELRKLSGLSRPALYNHLRELIRDNSVFKDTVKPDETDDPKRIGKVVYKTDKNRVESFVRQFLELRMRTLAAPMSKEMKKELEAHYDAIAKILSEFAKEWASRPLGKILEESRGE